jgi:protein-S-isoprenylcysteine O-methyltransferase Ste14
MTIDYYNWFQLAVLACLAFLGIGRALMLYARKVHVVVNDSHMSLRQKICGFLFVISFLMWMYEAIAHALSLPYHMPPPLLHSLLIQFISVKIFGASLMVVGLLIYGLALLAFGDSWRVGIDRKTPGTLITHGIFAWSRNPIYVSLDFLVFGTFLLQGHLLFLVFALCIPLLLHEQIRQEEHFLHEVFGIPYRAYCARVGRYFRLR